MKGLNKLAGTILKFVVIAAGAPLLVRGLYTTEIGNRILRVMPDSFWNTIYHRLELEGGRDDGKRRTCHMVDGLFHRLRNAGAGNKLVD